MICIVANLLPLGVLELIHPIIFFLLNIGGILRKRCLFVDTLKLLHTDG